MVNISKELELSALFTTLFKERITPDIVPKLFFTHFQSLGKLIDKAL